jgi:hypothetical protein
MYSNDRLIPPCPNSHPSSLSPPPLYLTNERMRSCTYVHICTVYSLVYNLVESHTDKHIDLYQINNSAPGCILLSGGSLTNFLEVAGKSIGIFLLSVFRGKLAQLWQSQTGLPQRSRVCQTGQQLWSPSGWMSMPNPPGILTYITWRQ